jgi:fucose permease
MSATSDTAVPDAAMRRDPLTWYSYLALAFFSYLNSIQGNIIPFLKAELNLTYSEVSLHPSALAVGSLLVGLAGDRVIRRFGRRRMLTVAVVGGSAGLLLLSLAGNIWMSVGSCLFMGCFAAFVPAMTSTILAELHGARRDVAYAEANALCYVFAITAPLVLGLTVWAGLNWRMGVVPGIATGFAVAAVFLRTPVPEQRVAVATSTAPLTPAFWAFWVMLAFSVAVEFSALLWAPSYLGQVIGLSPSAAALGAGAFFAGMLAGRAASVRLVRTFSLRNLFFGAITMGLVGFVAYWAQGGAIIAVAGLFVIGLGVAMLFPLTLGFAMTEAGAAGARASARLIIAPGIAVLLTPPLLGAIADHAGLWLSQLTIPAFLVLAVAAFLTGEMLTRRAAA